MAFEKYYDDTLPIVETPCIHLRSKGMIVTGEMKTPDHPDEVGADYCWCNLTQHVKGPDKKDVIRPDCIPGRTCFQETY